MTNVVSLAQSDPEPIPDFADFWTLYPRHIAKKDAARAWSKLTDAQRVDALVGAVAWRRVWATKDPEFIPHPATWLNGWRWEDEIPQGVTGPTHASHVATAANTAPRTTIPEHVRAALARLRGKP